MTLELTAIRVDRNGMPGRANPVGLERNIVFDRDGRVGVSIRVVESPVF